MACTYSVGEAGIAWSLTLTVLNDAGEVVPLTADAGDAAHIEFRRPDGTLVRRAATRDGGTVTWDMAEPDPDVLNIPGWWQNRAVVVRSNRAEIRSPWAPGFWVVR